VRAAQAELLLHATALQMAIQIFPIRIDISIINKIIFNFRDNVPAIELATWSVDSKLHDGEAAAGPVPAVFSEDMDSTKEALAANPLRTHQDLQRAMRVFLMPELIDLDEAMSLVKKPR
jgi:hypothetical protein